MQGAPLHCSAASQPADRLANPAGFALPGMLLFITLLVLFAACAGEAADGKNVTAARATDGENGPVRGMILEVVARSVTEVAALRIRDGQGKEWTFVTEGDVGISASHLREHQVSGQSVLVTYERKGDRLVASEIAD